MKQYNHIIVEGNNDHDAIALLDQFVGQPVFRCSGGDCMPVVIKAKSIAAGSLSGSARFRVTTVFYGKRQMQVRMEAGNEEDEEDGCAWFAQSGLPPVPSNPGQSTFSDATEVNNHIAALASDPAKFIYIKYVQIECTAFGPRLPVGKSLTHFPWHAGTRIGSDEEWLERDDMPIVVCMLPPAPSREYIGCIRLARRRFRRVRNAIYFSLAALSDADEEICKKMLLDATQHDCVEIYDKTDDKDPAVRLHELLFADIT